MVNKVYRADSTLISQIKAVNYKAAVNADEDLRPGCVSSAFITVDVFGSQSSAPSVGEALDYYFVDSGGNDVFVGTFYAEPAVRSKLSYRVTAYDAIHKLDVDYSARLADIQANFPMTLADLVTDACSVAGLSLADDQFPNYDLDINAFYVDGLTCRDILAYAAEMAGCFVRADSSGDVLFDWYATNSSARINPSSGNSGGVDLIAYKQNGLEYEQYSITPPPCVAVRPSGSEGVAYIYPNNVASVYATDVNNDGNVVLYNLVAVDDGNGNITLSGDLTATESNGDVVITATGSGSMDNALIVNGNILLTGADDATYLAVATRIYNAMQAIGNYRPARAELFPTENPFVLGEIIAVKDSQNVTFNMPVMSLTLSNAAAVVEATGNKTRAESNGVERSLAQLANDVVQLNKLKVDWAEINEAIINTVEANELKSSDFVPANDGIFAYSGMAIDLANKNIKAVDFAVDDNGKLYANAADFSGINFGATYITTALIYSAGTVQDGYTKYGSIPYRKLKSVTLPGLTVDAIDAKFDYYDNGTLVETYSLTAMPVSPFYIPLYSGTADAVDVWLKLPAGESTTLNTVSVSTFFPIMVVPSNAQVVFNNKPNFDGGAKIDGVDLDSSSIVSASQRFSVSAGSSTTKTIESSTRGVLMTSGYNNNVMGIWMWACSSSGTIMTMAVQTASGISLSTAANALTISNSSQNAAFGIMINF